MRIRHNRSEQSTNQTRSCNSPTVSTSNKQLFNVGNFTKIPELSMKYKQGSNSDDGQVSSMSHLPETSDDPNNAYLNPDFLDPLFVTKCDSNGPSPLALLARTCQNIGNIMDYKVNNYTNLSVRKSSTGLFTATASTPPTITIPAILSAAPVTNNATPTMRMNTTQSTNASVTLGSGVTNNSHKSCKNAKFHNDTMNITKKNGISKLKLNNAINYAIQANKDKSIHNNSKTNGQSASPPNISPHLGSVNYDCLIDSSRGKMDQLDDTSQTSNALAQLARLSSSFALPDTPKSQMKRQINAVNNQPIWNDTMNMVNGFKKSRKASGSLIKCTSSEYNATNNFRNLVRDNNCSSLSQIPINPGVMDNLSNGNQNGNVNTSPGIPLNMTTHTASPIQNMNHNRIISNSDNSANLTADKREYINQTSDWATFLKYGEQLLAQKEQLSHRPNEKDDQDVFSYQLARNFLDYFYGKFAGLKQNEQAATSILRNAPKMDNRNSECDTQNRLKRELDKPQINMNTILNPESFRPNPTDQATSNPHLVNEMDKKPCFVCGQTLSTNAELCMHVYTHLIAVQKQDPCIIKSTDSYESGASQNNGSTTLCNFPTVWSLMQESESQNKQLLEAQKFLSQTNNLNQTNTFNLLQNYLTSWMVNMNSAQTILTNNNTNCVSHHAELNKLTDQEKWQNLLHTYIKSLTDISASQSSSLPTAVSTNLNSFDNSFWYNSLFNPKTNIIPFPQS